MCIGKPECQLCQTCGRRKYQLWASAEMHDRGCPWGFDRMDECVETVNYAKLLKSIEIGSPEILKPGGIALIAQMEAAGVDLTATQVEFHP